MLDGPDYIPVAFDRCEHVGGPFFHGTKTAFAEGELLVPGHLSNYHEGRTSNHVYIVEPTGPFEDDPNLTNKRFPGNVTRSYRTRHPLRIVDALHTWEGHRPEVLHERVERIVRLRAQGLDIIED